MTYPPATLPAIIAFDLGTHMGWCIANSPYKDGYIASGHIELGKGVERYVNFQNFLKKIEDQYVDSMFDKNLAFDQQIRKVYYENVRYHTGTEAAHVYGGFKTFLSVWCEKNNLYIQGIEPTAIKKRASGKGHASKELMVQTSNLLPWNLSITDHNEADAVCLAHVAMCDINLKKLAIKEATRQAKECGIEGNCNKDDYIDRLLGNENNKKKVKKSFSGAWKRR